MISSVDKADMLALTEKYTKAAGEKERHKEKEFTPIETSSYMKVNGRITNLMEKEKKHLKIILNI